MLIAEEAPVSPISALGFSVSPFVPLAVITSFVSKSEIIISGFKYSFFISQFPFPYLFTVAVTVTVVPSGIPVTVTAIRKFAPAEMVSVVPSAAL